MLRKKRFINSVFVILFALSTTCFSSPYRIKPDLKAELIQNELAFKKAPDSNDARFELAMSYAYTGQIMDGWSLFKKLPKSYSQEVVAKYEPLTKNEKENWKAPFKLAFGYYFAKRKQDALPLFEESYRRNPDNIWALGFLALVKGDLGEIDEAIRICKEALKKEPNATAIHFLLGEGYRRKGQYGKFMSEMMLVGRLQAEEALDRSDGK